MTKSEWAPCEQCMRYLRTTETVCPFCGASFVASRVVRSTGLGRGASRAAVFALRTALIAGTAGATGCGSDANDEAQDAGGQGHDAAAENDAAQNDAAQDAAAHEDAGVDTDAAQIADAGDAGEGDADADEDAFVPVPIYGGSFVDPRTRAKV